jgi:hypothetical protein
MEEITKEELEKTLHSFQKDKSPGPDGFQLNSTKDALRSLERTS